MMMYQMKLKINRGLFSPWFHMRTPHQLICHPCDYEHRN